MKRTAMVVAMAMATTVAILSTAIGAGAQGYGAGGQQTPPVAAQGGQTAPAGQAAPRKRRASQMPGIDWTVGAMAAGGLPPVAPHRPPRGPFHVVVDVIVDVVVDGDGDGDVVAPR